MTWLGSIRVRPATLEDSSSIGEVHVTAWKETYRGMVPDSMLAALSFGKALFEVMGCDLRKIGNGKFSLGILRENTRARTFYEHLGGQLVAATRCTY